MPLKTGKRLAASFQKNTAPVLYRLKKAGAKTEKSYESGRILISKSMKNIIHLIYFIVIAPFLSSMTPQEGGGGFGLFLFILVIIAVIILAAVKTRNQGDDVDVTSDQNNKVLNVTLIGGLIGLFGSSPQKKLNSRIKKENLNGWRVVQIIPADSGNVFLFIFRLLILIITLFLYTTANGYYVIMERTENDK